MKNTKRILALALSLVLCFSLTACGKDDEEENVFVEPDGTVVQQAPPQEEVSVEPDPTPAPQPTPPPEVKVPDPIPEKAPETEPPTENIEPVEKEAEKEEVEPEKHEEEENVVDNENLREHKVQLTVNKYEEEAYSDLITGGSGDLMTSNIEKLKPKLLEMGFTTEAEGTYTYKNISGPVWVARNPNNGQMFYFLQNETFAGYAFTDTFSDTYAQGEVDMLMENYYLFSKTTYNNLHDEIYEIMSDWDNIKKNSRGQYKYHAQTLNVQEHMAVDFVGQESDDRISMLVALTNFVITDEIYTPTTFEFKDIRVGAEKFSQIQYTEESADYRAPVFMDMNFKFDGHGNSTPTAEDTSVFNKLSKFGYNRTREDESGKYLSDPYNMMVVHENKGKIDITIESVNFKYFTFADAKTEFVNQLAELGITDEGLGAVIDEVINSQETVTEKIMNVTRDATPGKVTVNKSLTTGKLIIKYADN